MAMTKQIFIAMMIVCLLGATTANAAVLCHGDDDSAMQHNTMQAEPCHQTSKNADNNNQCDNCSCMHIVPMQIDFVEYDVARLIISSPVILWSERDSSSSAEDIFQPPI
jgi:hypothetical protein